MTKLKQEIEDILHPPIISEKSVERNIREGVEPVIESQGDVRHLRAVENQSSNDSRPIIDFNAIARASEFQRFIYWIRTGKVFRGSNKELEKDLWNTQKDIEIIEELKAIDPNARNFGNVINEFKAKVERLKKRS